MRSAIHTKDASVTTPSTPSLFSKQLMWVITRAQCLVVGLLISGAVLAEELPRPETGSEEGISLKWTDKLWSIRAPIPPLLLKNVASVSDKSPKHGIPHCAKTARETAEKRFQVTLPQYATAFDVGDFYQGLQEKKSVPSIQKHWSTPHSFIRNLSQESLEGASGIIDVIFRTNHVYSKDGKHREYGHRVILFPVKEWRSNAREWYVLDSAIARNGLSKGPLFRYFRDGAIPLGVYLKQMQRYTFKAWAVYSTLQEVISDATLVAQR